MKQFEFKIKVKISDNWIEDGWNSELIKDSLKNYIESEMNPYAYSGIEFVAEIEESKVKS